MDSATSLRPPAPGSYLDWNDRLAALYFNPQNAGRPVSLFVTDESVASLAGGDQAALAQFITSVKQGPPWAAASTLCGRAIDAFEHWRERGLDYPPYVAYLGLFVIAAGFDTDVAPHAYYARLWRLLGEAGQGMPKRFDDMKKLWADLEAWSVEDKQGALGIFHMRSVGKWQHVGIPKAQTLLDEEERRALPHIFTEAALDPHVPPAEGTLARHVFRAGQGALRNRTLSLLRGEGNVEMRAALLESLTDALSEWDGSAAPTEGPAAQPRQGQLRISLDLDRTARRARAFLRCSIPGAAEGSSIVLRAPGGGYLTAEIVASGLTAALTTEDGLPLPAGSLDWMNGAALSSDAEWTFRLPGSAVRVFSDAAPLGLRGFIEVRQLPRNAATIILTSSAAAGQIASWLAHASPDWREIAVNDGLPLGWRLFEARCITSDAAVRDAHPVLTFPLTARIRIEGGIRAEAGSTYFLFAAPEVLIEGGSGGERLSDNGESMPSAQFPNRYRFTSRREGPHTIEARGEELVLRKIVWLTEPRPSPGAEPELWTDAVGRPAALGAPRVHGAAVENAPPAIAFDPEIPHSPPVLLIGKREGEIADWPRETPEWSPVWAVSRGRHPAASYVGTSPAEDNPTGNPSEHTPLRRVRAWRQALWCDRRRTKPPAHPAAAALWARYREAARHRR